MYALALSLSAAASLPFFHYGELPGPLPIQAFGVIVAVGVLIGASLLRRYAEWHGVSDEHIRGLLGWVTVAGFLGAHEFDMIAYQWDKIGEVTHNVPASWWPLGEALWPTNWPLPLKIWEGISSYGGFIGGAIGFAIYVWWKRLPVRLMADVTIVGLLVAFSIGRIACTVVSDHIGAAVDPTKWYAVLAMDYPRTFGKLNEHYPELTGPTITAWNLGFVEFLYLVPVNIIVLYLAFRPSKRLNAGFITVLTGILYAPVRFFLDFLRPEDSDPRHLGLTFAQWASLLAFGVALYVLARIMKNGKPAEPVARTSGEAQRKLRLILNEGVLDDKPAASTKITAETKPEVKVKTAEEKAAEREEEELAKEALAAKVIDDAPAAAEADAQAEAAPVAAKPAAANKPKPGGGGGNKHKKKR